MFRIFNKIKKSRPEPKKRPEKIHLTKKLICDILELPFDGEDEEYNCLSYSTDAVKGDIVILQKPRRSPFITYSEEEVFKMADRAMKKGAKRLISTYQVKDYPCLVIQEPMIDSLTKLIHELWKDIKPMTLSVTGSYGKTTVVSMLEATLGTKHKVYGHDGDSLNMVPHTISRVQSWDPSYDIFIQEAAEGAHAGVPAVISKMLEPDVCLVTNVGTSHIERMGSQEVIFESCIGIQEGLSENGLLILNGDDPFLKNAETKRKTIYYGMENEKVDYRAVNAVSTSDGISFDILHDGKLTHCEIPCVGVHNAQNAAGTFAAAKACGMSDKDAAGGLSLYHPKGYRQRMYHSGKYHFFLDCYNSSVESVRSALDATKDMVLREGGKRIAVMADIAQAGEFAEEYHKEVGRYAASSNLDILICYGENKDIVAMEAAKNPHLRIFKAETIGEIEELLKDNVEENDVILLKGSHSMELYLIPNDLVGARFKKDGTEEI
ncbi:MAG: UDP-N-acetylmuramoyl-tripeptide--D-alanyl-D-alanine ligase [Firmicutes bacterium]|nr:UDP-N-acetylmuramoyl-tripeptide--D-alanyl-D-alanine ligase [Bacillota bacterium]